MEAEEFMNTIPNVIVALNVVVFITLIVQTSRRKPPPLWLFAIIGFSVGMGITDAIIRQSIWSMLASIVMVAVGVLLFLSRSEWLKNEERRKRKENP